MFSFYKQIFPQTCDDYMKGLYCLLSMFILAYIAYHDYIRTSFAGNIIVFLRCSS
ncbi:protein U24A [macacine betaherpesvirus 9]|uniref:Protein U24A n=1 Tax=macacine betaherpesvirus 9 TaxID=2560568 RepID=A0A192XPE7_9BETA|nr:protein U24A [macacine betaherpesvirus 9]ANC96596.1 protein U24A [macacine betaherpesvirus 9]